jgi:hypothetical protein
MVKAGEEWTAKPVTLGSSNEKFVVVNDGLTEQDFVALNPVELLEEVELPDAPPPDAAEGEQIAADARPASVTPIASPVAGSESANNAPSQGAPDPAAIAGAIFARGDANKDGKLSQDEMPEQFRSSFAQTDANGDGGIDQGEMQTAMQRRMRERAAANAGPSGAEE